MNTEKVLIILIVIFSILGGLLSISNAPLRGEEPRRAVVAYESMSNDNACQPTSFKIAYYNKPPAYNWILAPFFKAFGYSKFVLRLPGLLSLLLFVFFIFRITKNFEFKLRLLSSLIFLTLGDFLFYQSVFAGEIDLIFSSLILALIYYVYCYLDKSQPIYLMISGVIASIAFLIKGIPAIVFLLATVFVVFLIKKKLFPLIIHGFLSVVVFIGIVAGVFYLNEINGGDSHVYLINLFAETSKKSLEGSDWTKNLIHLFTFPLEILKYLLPWVIIPIVAFKKINWSLIKQNQMLRFIVLVILINIIPYWLSPETRGRYLLVFLPLFSILLAFGISQLVSKSKWNKLEAVLFRLVQVLSIALIVASIYFVASGYSSLVLSLFVCSVLGFLLWKASGDFTIKLYHFALVLLIAKVIYSDSLLKKDLQNDQGRHEILNTLLEKTNGNEFYLTGDITGEEISISILGKELFKDELYATPALAFEYPFYYIQEQGNILQYARKMKVDNYYIMPEGAYKKNLIPFFESDLLHEFYEDWTQQNYSLVYIRKEK